MSSLSSISSWSSYSSSLSSTSSYSPNDLISSFSSKATNVSDYNTSKSNWYYDQIFENPYLSSNLYYFNGESKYVDLGKCIVGAPNIFVQNDWGKSAATVFSAGQTAMYRGMQNLLSRTTPTGQLVNTIFSQVNEFAQAANVSAQDENPSSPDSVSKIISDNVKNLSDAVTNATSYMSGVQFENDAEFSRFFRAFGAEYPIKATFFFLQTTAKDSNTNRDLAGNLMKYVLPYQQVNKSLESLLNSSEATSGLVSQINESITNISSAIGATAIKESINNAVTKVLKTGVLTTYSPGGYKTDPQSAMTKAAENKQISNTFVIVTPWGIRRDLLPADINISESTAKVVINGSKVLPMFIQVNIGFVASRKLLSTDIMQQVSGKYEEANDSSK